APTGDWSIYSNEASIPTQCADGTNGTVFANSTPNVSLFARDYTSPRSLRSNLQWSGPILGNRFSAALEGTYSLNVDQPSFVDLNFSNTVGFTLADEGGRPVFAQPSSIVPSTGSIASRDARRFPNVFSRVAEMRSDM